MRPKELPISAFQIVLFVRKLVARFTAVGNVNNKNSPSHPLTSEERQAEIFGEIVLNSQQLHMLRMFIKCLLLLWGEL